MGLNCVGFEETVDMDVCLDQEPPKAPPQSSKASLAIFEGILKGNKYAPSREVLKCSWSVGPLPQQMFSDTQTILLEVAESCSTPIGTRKAVGSPVLDEGDAGSLATGEFLDNDVVSALGSNLDVASDLGVFEALKCTNLFS